jgi:hypothetical protein
LNGAAFVPEKFRLGKKTPGSENDCTGRAFFLEERIINVLPVYHDVRCESQLDNSQHIFTECSSSIQTSDNRSIVVELLHQEIQTELTAAEHDSCTKLLLAPDSGNIRQELDSSNARKRRISDVHDYYETPEWETDKYFTDEWIAQITAHQNKILPVDLIRNNKVWFEYLFDKNDPSKSHFRCRICYIYYDKLGYASNHKPAVATKEGVLKAARYENKGVIESHDSSRGSIINYIKIVHIFILLTRFNSFQPISTLFKTFKGTQKKVSFDFDQIQKNEEERFRRSQNYSTNVSKYLRRD